MSEPPSDSTRVIAERAASLWERLALAVRDAQAHGVNATAHDAASDATRRIDRWRHVVARGDADAFERRLAWDGLSLRDAEVALARDSGAPGNAPWVTVLRDVLRSTERPAGAPDEWSVADPTRPRPFEEILLPLVHAARGMLRRVVAPPGHDGPGGSGDRHALPRGRLAVQAYLSLERGLLDRLCRVAAPTLLAEFTAARPAGHGLLRALLGHTGTAGRTHYERFVRRYSPGHLGELFLRYPVLARVVAEVVDGWVEFCAGFLSHLEEDADEISRCFRSAPAGPPREVVDVRYGLSDFHRNGRCVLRVLFENGLTLAYKPRSLGIDRLFGDIVEWLNQQDGAVDLRAVRVLDRDGHGWAEWIEQRPCHTPQEVQRFYKRAGALLALLHALRATDVHYENLVARGDHPVLVDAETLLEPEPGVDRDGEAPAPDAWFWQSVIRTGMLPQWESLGTEGGACDISALGSVESQRSPAAVPRWEGVNTDDMDVSYAPVDLPRQRNAPLLDGVAVSPGDHATHVAKGFTSTYRILMRQHAGLLARGSLLDRALGCPVRWVPRRTEQYGRIMQRSLAPEVLGDGRDRSIEIDHLARGTVMGSHSAAGWAIVRAERRALERLDIPRFEVAADGTTVTADGDVVAAGFFAATGLEGVRDRMSRMNEQDLRLQAGLVNSSLRAWAMRPPVRRVVAGAGGSREHHQPSPHQSPAGDESVPTSARHGNRRAAFLDAALAIADGIESSAVQDRDGSVGWVAVTPVVGVGRHQVAPANDGLYGGRGGIAWFLAACDRVEGGSRRAPVIDGALLPLRRQLRDGDVRQVEAFVRRAGLGIADGVGGLLYALASIATWRADETLLGEALLLASAVPQDLVTDDEHLDVIGGVAGLIHGLARLHLARPTPGVADLVAACGARLWATQLRDGEGAGGWPTRMADRPLTGASHGASGMAAALGQVHFVQADERCKEAIAAALDFEQRARLPESGNWADFRTRPTEADASASGVPTQTPPEAGVSWCHGAPGILVSRLLVAPVVRHPGLDADVEVALETTTRRQQDLPDHLCCGTAGRADILLYAGRTLSRQDAVAAALAEADGLLARSAHPRVPPGSAFGTLNPGLFDGLAGVGYALLRLAAPDEVPCVLAWE